MRRLLLAAPLLALTVTLSMPAAQVVTLKAAVEPTAVPPGSHFEVAVTFMVEESWYIYGLGTQGGPVATSLSLEGPEGFEAAGAPREPEPHVKFDEGFLVDLPTHAGEVTIRLTGRASEDLAAGVYELQVQAGHQACQDGMCLRPTREDLTVEIEIDPEADFVAAPADSGTTITPPPSGTPPLGLTDQDRDMTQRMQGVMDQGLIHFLLIAGLMGFASLLTPCVFPMIPITVSLFTKRGEKGEGSPLTAALVYAAAIIGTYTLLGLILAATWGASGARQVAADPWINLGIGALFVAMALMLFGLWELRVPGWLLNIVGRGQQRGGLMGILFMGLAFTLTSFTCTVAFVGFLLGQAAQGNWLWPGMGMLVFSACFSLPFFLLALFPTWLSRLPAAGNWMHATKILMGLLELAAALKFFSNSDLVWEWGVLRNTAVLGLWTLITLLMALYLLGALRFGHAPLRGWGAARLALVAGTVALTLTLGVGLLGGPLPIWVATYLPEVGEDEFEWVEDLDVGLAQARESGRPVFIDFTGYTCTNCRQMEIQVFPDPEVRHLMEDYVLVRLYTDDRETGDRWADLQEERFQTSALPFYALLTPDDVVIDTRAGMVRPASAFADFLQSGLEVEI